mmetsp:Transcript_129673/g.276645  ORF Transcript_129673/g.276645 Transcript_129673/m.276645 type:complete len:263 (+) Transcript_129673:68-856(+)
MTGTNLIALLSFAFTGAAIEDTVSLVQKSVKLHDDTCTCLSWHDAYHSLNAKCGDGHEMDLVPTLPGPEAAQIPQLSFEFCEMYFSNLPDSNFCQNEKWVQEPAQWCYVSKECSQSKHLHGPLSTKTCTTGRDTLLADMKFEDFAAYAYSSKLELGLMVQFAYPTWEHGKLPDVQAFWGLPAGEGAAPISEELRAELQELVDSGKTMFFVSRNGHPPFGVAEGKKLYYVNFNPAGNPGFEKKEDMNTWGCVAGCGSDNMALW